ncbi:MAG TPA: methylated-DNA--[protein]-cysteine S-methyltransferase [Anaerolineales bacterium]|jgi:O-6-methylguanine DNA methyltransferase
MPSSPPIYLGELNQTTLGDLRLAASDLGLVAVEWSDSQPELDRYLQRLGRTVVANSRKIAPFADQVREYLLGERKRFTFRIDWSLLRPFQREVLQATFAIPYGETRTYRALSHQLGRPRAARAVGRAEATTVRAAVPAATPVRDGNPMPLVVPCHRLIGSDGKLHGYGGGEGLKTKEWLLKMEGAVIA